jgi:hypothetical protein
VNKKLGLSRLPAKEWEALPDEIEMRIIRTKGPDREGKQRTRYVVTTLLDAEKYGSPSDWLDGKLSKFQPSVGKVGDFACPMHDS